MQFIQENNMTQIKIDPTTKLLEQTQQAIQRCKQMINRKIHKHMINTQSKAPNLNAHIKKNKETFLKGQ